MIVKRINVLLLMILAVAVGLFAGYHLWVHNRLDTTGPVLTVEEGMLEISVKDRETALMKGIHAEDDRDGDVTASILVESIYGISEDHVTTVTYAAFDRAGNVTKLQRKVRFVDYQSPRFEAYGSLTFPGNIGFDLMDYVGAYDVLEGDIRRRVHATLVSDTKSISAEGNHQVKLMVTNSLGDTVEVVIPVMVYSSEWYTADVRLTNHLIYLKQGSAFQAEDYLKTFVFRGDPIDIGQEIPEDINVEIQNGVRTDVPGVYEVTYILSKNLNGTNHSGVARLIVIVE
jgi:hypothetical protein